MNEKNYQMILEDTAADVEKAHAVLFAVCTALQNKVALPSMMPALWDTVHRLFNVSERINTALEAGADNSGEE